MGSIISNIYDKIQEHGSWENYQKTLNQSQMEQFRIWHNNKTKPRNRMESHIIDFVKKMLSEPVGLTIHQVRAAVENEVSQFSLTCKNPGSVTVGIVNKAGSYIAFPNIYTRRFSIYGRGRGTPTLNIHETVDKDENNDFKPAVKPWKNESNSF